MQETEYPPFGGYFGDFHIYEPHIYTKCVALTTKVYRRGGRLQRLPYFTFAVPLWICWITLSACDVTAGFAASAALSEAIACWLFPCAK